MMGINGGQFLFSMTIPAANEKEGSMTLKGRGNEILNCNSNSTRTKLAGINFPNHSSSKSKFNARSFQMNFLVNLLGQYLVHRLFQIITTNIEKITTSTHKRTIPLAAASSLLFNSWFQGNNKIR
jgi:hypothetical protein